MFDVSIKVIKITEYDDLKVKYEINPSEIKCFMKVGDTFISRSGNIPEGFCLEAWKCIDEYVLRLAKGEENIFGEWLKNKKSLILSCNDGIRPVSFLLEIIQ